MLFVLVSCPCCNLMECLSLCSLINFFCVAQPKIQTESKDKGQVDIRAGTISCFTYQYIVLLTRKYKRGIGGQRQRREVKELNTKL